MPRDDALTQEIQRIKNAFPGADENKMKVLEGLIEQAAYERLYLKNLNESAIVTGLVKVNPENATMQRALPVSTEITKHSAALTNILDKLCKHLAVTMEEGEDELADFE